MATIDNYSRDELLGEGTFGKVYRATCRRTGRVVALKLIKINGDSDEGIQPTALREISLLKDLHGEKNIVEYVCICGLVASSQRTM